ncbi:GNAT family N-acetyltransferase [Acidaminobacter sp. JC074]|uniref:GNAT family N-acetyltransferase n=1 Tax=Acidaminobacter sp. JC074 TaxID=2530199 RepID=UPI001F0F747D|nr:GNAT family N-acetyltransferase [Acidaminobacter sp. JC074]MCH4888377.1 GNAT family N-acetyltransferase [Acidaminobacter sp. JC074]
MEIRQSDLKSPYLKQLYKMFLKVWDHVDAFEETKNGLELPYPILALEEGDLIGGLSFTAYQHPDKDQMALWINALYVDRAFRGKHVASNLISYAEEKAREMGYTEILVYTDLASLYLKLGYKSLSYNGSHTVLLKTL